MDPYAIDYDIHCSAAVIPASWHFTYNFNGEVKIVADETTWVELSNPVIVMLPRNFNLKGRLAFYRHVVRGGKNGIDKLDFNYELVEDRGQWFAHIDIDKPEPFTIDVPINHLGGKI